jgi:hypothetical protein
MESPYIADFERTEVDPQKKIIIDRRAPVAGVKRREGRREQRKK